MLYPQRIHGDAVRISRHVAAGGCGSLLFGPRTARVDEATRLALRRRGVFGSARRPSHERPGIPERDRSGKRAHPCMSPPPTFTSVAGAAASGATGDQFAAARRRIARGVGAWSRFVQRCVTATRTDDRRESAPARKRQRERAGSGTQPTRLGPPADGRRRAASCRRRDSRRRYERQRQSDRERAQQRRSCSPSHEGLRFRRDSRCRGIGSRLHQGYRYRR